MVVVIGFEVFETINASKARGVWISGLKNNKPQQQHKQLTRTCCTNCHNLALLYPSL